MNISSSGRRVRILCAVGIVALVGSVISVSPTLADERDSARVEKSVRDSDSDGTLDASDAGDASAAAVEAGEPVEDLSKRTESSTLVANPDGTWTAKDFGEPVRIRRDGKWVDVDYTLTKQSDGSWSPKAAPVDVTVDGGSSKEAAQVTFDDGSSMAVTWPEDLPTPNIEGGVATYELSDAVDLIVAVTGSGVATRIRLNEAPTDDDPVFPLGLTTEGLKLDQNAAGGVTAKDASGKTVGSTSTLVAWDARTDHAGEPAEIVPVEATLDQTSVKGKGDDTVRTHDLDLRGPSEILDDPKTKYPVIIDPDINAVTQWRDTWVRSGTTANQGNSYRLLVGSLGGDSNPNPARTLIQWHETQFAGKDIVSATMGVYQYDAGSCSPRDMYVLPLAAGFTEASTVWTNTPNYIPSSGDNVTVTANRSRTGCSVGNGYTTANITKMVTSWAAGRYTNNGLLLAVPAAVGNDTTYERRFCSWEPDTSQTQTPCTVATRMPYLSVTYNTRPTASAVAPVVDQASPGQVKVSAGVSDPDGGSSWAEFTVKRGSTVVFRGLSTSGSGATQTVDVPDLPKGQYTVTARAYDGRLFSTNSTPSTTFTVAADATDVLGDSFAAVTSTQVASLTLPGATLDPETGEMGSAEEFIQIAGLAGVPDNEETGRAAVVSMRTSGWSSAGGVSLVNPDGEQPTSPTVGITTSMNPSTAITSTSIVGLSEEGEVTVVNTSSDPVTVVVSVQGWYSMAAAPIDTPIGPQVDPDVILDAPAQGPSTVTFTPPVDETYTLAGATSNEVAMSVAGTLTGHYSPHAVDDAGQTVPATIAAVGGDLVVTATPPTGSTYPITVVPTFEASTPSSATVQELYPEPAAPVDPGDAPMTPEDVIEIVDEASQQLVIDLENPESLPDYGTATGQMTTMASAPSKASVPHWTRSNGSKIWPKYYVYDPNNKNGRSPARKGWHDYCSGLSIPGPDLGVPDSARFTYPSGNPRYPNYTPSVSFKGPCARHDLCIQYKQAPTRFYCDDELKTHIRMNCRYYIRADLYPARKKGLEACYSRAGLYHYWTRWITGGKTDSGKWGHSQYASVYPTYRYDDWTQ